MDQVWHKGKCLYERLHHITQSEFYWIYIRQLVLVLFRIFRSPEHKIDINLIQRNHRAHSDSQVEASTTNVAPVPSAHIELSESSSKHIVFNTNLPGRAVVSAERVMRYGRHSGDSRLRTLKTSARNVKDRKIGPRSIVSVF